MSSATADSYPESVSSCRPPTPPTPSPLPRPPATTPEPAPAVARGGSARRQLDFADADAGAGAGGDLEDGDDFLSAVDVDDIVRGYEAKRQAPPCVCGRGACAVRRDEQSGRWMYVCSSQPKCKHTALCEEASRSPESLPAVWSHPKTSNPCVFDTPINHVNEPRTPINNLNLQRAGVTTPVNVSPQAAIPKTQLYSTFQVKVSPQGARSNNQWPICQCTAGKCKILKGLNEDFYVCPIRKGQGACSYKVPVIDSVRQAQQTGDDNIMGGKHLKDSPVEKKAHANDVVQVGEKNANGSLKQQPLLKFVRDHQVCCADQWPRRHPQNHPCHLTIPVVP
ncbi:hypothetical protein HU200_038332 [Digitaria exilis]|uniref:Uncharacterized protein n=1 Tax=Digitaria exilis TaxID=1010633 RepID=A0A835BNZ0_9POAL|nr:hypothetical protein HU200_038332 [Digitaria exilis]